MEPYPLYPHTFSRALPYVDHNQSVAIYLDLRAAGYIDQQGFGRLPQAVNLTEWSAAEPLRFAVLSGTCTAQAVLHSSHFCVACTMADAAKAHALGKPCLASERNNCHFTPANSQGGIRCHAGLKRGTVWSVSLYHTLPRTRTGHSRLSSGTWGRYSKSSMPHKQVCSLLVQLPCGCPCGLSCKTLVFVLSLSVSCLCRLTALVAMQQLGCKYLSCALGPGACIGSDRHKWPDTAADR